MTCKSETHLRHMTWEKYSVAATCKLILLFFSVVKNGFDLRNQDTTCQTHSFKSHNFIYKVCTSLPVSKHTSSSLFTIPKTTAYLSPSEKWSSLNKPSNRKWICSKRTGKNISTGFRLALARGERLPEEVAAARLALSLGDRKVPPHHLLPDSYLLALQLGEHLVSSQKFGHKFQQEQVSEILKGRTAKERNWGCTSDSHFSHFKISAVQDVRGTHLVVSEVCSQCFHQHVSAWSAADPHQQHRGKQSHKEYLHLGAKHLHLKQRTQGIQLLPWAGCPIVFKKKIWRRCSEVKRNCRPITVDSQRITVFE